MAMALGMAREKEMGGNWGIREGGNEIIRKEEERGRERRKGG